jgi:hypothetical protein
MSTCNLRTSPLYKACSKKDRTFAIKTLLLILHHFKHCPLQSSPLYWRYTIPNVFSIVGMLRGTHFLWWCAVLLSNFPESPLCHQFGDVLSGCNSTTNAHSEMGQMAVCCQNLTLGALSSCSALSMPVGALFKKFGLIWTPLVHGVLKRLETHGLYHLYGLMSLKTD